MPTSRGPRSSGPGRRPAAGQGGLRGTGARPGERTSRSRAGSRRPGATRKPASAPSAPEETGPTIVREESRVIGAVRQRASVTSRAIALAVVLLILTISYASSLRVYFNQRQQLAQTRQQIIKSQADINSLSDEISRWNDPDYVRTQARIRLGWVLPGERGYRVVDANGKPISGDTEIAGSSQPQPTPKTPWYSKLMGSVDAADHPQPAKPDPGDAPPITKNSKPDDSGPAGSGKPTSKPTG
jgi:cell division protein FtsB